MSQGKEKVYVVFNDYQKVFDKMNRVNLWPCLLAKGLSRKILNIIRSITKVFCAVSEPVMIILTFSSVRQE